MVETLGHKRTISPSEAEKDYEKEKDRCFISGQVARLMDLAFPIRESVLGAINFSRGINDRDVFSAGLPERYLIEHTLEGDSGAYAVFIKTLRPDLVRDYFDCIERFGRIIPKARHGKSFIEGLSTLARESTDDERLISLFTNPEYTQEIRRRITVLQEIVYGTAYTPALFPENTDSIIPMDNMTFNRLKSNALEFDISMKESMDLANNSEDLQVKFAKFFEEVYAAIKSSRMTIEQYFDLIASMPNLYRIETELGRMLWRIGQYPGSAQQMVGLYDYPSRDANKITVVDDMVLGCQSGESVRARVGYFNNIIEEFSRVRGPLIVTNFAAGPGELEFINSTQNISWTAIDGDRDACDYNAQRNPDITVLNADLTGDYDDFPCADICLNVGMLDYFNDEKKVDLIVKALSRLRPGGLFVAGIFAKNHQDIPFAACSGWTLYRVTEEELQAIGETAVHRAFPSGGAKVEIFRPNLDWPQLILKITLLD